MASSVRNASVPRPTVKRAAYTWPGNAASRTHFEDFLREIGETSQAAQFLCCIPRSSATPCAHAHLHKRSSSTVGSKARSSSRAYDKSRASDEEASPRAPVSSPLRPDLEARGRTRTVSSPRVSGTLTSGLPVSLKSPALASIDLEAHDASASYSYLSSARDSLLSCIYTIPVDERPSRAPTRSFHGPSPSRRSSDSSASPRPSPSPPSSQIPFPSSRQRDARAVSRDSVLADQDHQVPQDHHSYPHHHRRSPSHLHSHLQSGSLDPSPSLLRQRDRSPSRTPSIDSLDTASSSEAPATPRTQAELTLGELERTSRFRVPSVCVACRRTGANFPSCAKCGETLCSRECRVRGRAHACHGRPFVVGVGGA
ncbi:hypothetical protein C8Q76DRAFT_479933 [Earliella scabrosa]|nr:hypothetical protein C8Q76DRAFT_479933 [Earliella scabrosa]